jgi:CRM1 C terminal
MPNNRAAIGTKMLETLSNEYQNLKLEDHQQAINNLFLTMNSKENFNTAISDYLVMLDVFTNKEAY